MKTSLLKNLVAVAAIVFVVAGTAWAVRRYHRPGQLDVLSAQAMDMSQMRPPTGAAPVALAFARQGSLADTVTYTGTVLAYNEQEISPRIAGKLVSLPLYPGDLVRAGQVVARLDAAEVGAQADQAAAQAQAAQFGAQTARLTHHLHHQAALEQAEAQRQAAVQGITDAQAQAQADLDAVADVRAGVQSAQAGVDYWKTETPREKQLADAGAVSRQEYQNEVAQASAAGALLSQAQAKVRQAQATARASQGKVAEMRRQADAALAGVRLARADLLVAAGQASQAAAGAAAAQAAARQAGVVQSYGRIVSPANGVVTARPVAPGTLVQPGTVILRVAEIDRVRVQANVAVEDMAGIRVGSPVSLFIQGGSKTAISARVTSVFPAASDQTRTAVVETIVPNPARRLLPGAFVTMRISRNMALNTLLVPASAVTSEGGASYVWTTSGSASAGGVIYECAVCHMHYSAAQAARFHYHDPMDGGLLTPLKNAASTASPRTLTVRRVAVRAGASDGAWTEVTGDQIAAGTQVVTQGQAGLTDGTPVVATAWGAEGPRALPSAASANQGKTVYRCEKCGMTYSAADARRNHFIDPMDGGKLVPVESK